MPVSTSKGTSHDKWNPDERHHGREDFDIAPASYTEARGTRTLLFWGDYPHWVIVNPAGELVLRLISKGLPIREIVHSYAAQTGLDVEEATEDIAVLVDPLIEVGVIYRKGCPLHLPSISQQLDMELLCRNIAEVVTNLTGRCNYRCRHCYADASPNPRDELSADEVIAIVHQVDQYCSEKVLGVLGGEPLI